jgi:hypothetical protein
LQLFWCLCTKTNKLKRRKRGIRSGQIGNTVGQLSGTSRSSLVAGEGADPEYADSEGAARARRRLAVERGLLVSWCGAKGLVLIGDFARHNIPFRHVYRISGSGKVRRRLRHCRRLHRASARHTNNPNLLFTGTHTELG